MCSLHNNQIIEWLQSYVTPRHLNISRTRDLSAWQKANGEMQELSDIYYSLPDADSKKCYKRKLTLFKDQDPYVLANKKILGQTDGFPDFRLAEVM